MAFPTYTYTFTNGSTADATQVNQDFTDILNGISDTTKDISVNNITGAGTATLNGNVVLGNSSSKTINSTGTYISALVPNATNTYDFGAATTGGWRSLYLSSGAAAFTTRLVGQTTAANVTITMPAVTDTLIGLVTQPGAFYWAGGYPASGTNCWTTTSATPASNFTVNGTIPSPSSSGAGITVAKATSNLPGINIASAPRTGVLEVVFKAQITIVSGGTPTGALNLIESTTSTTLDQVGFFLAAVAISGATQELVLSGFMPVTISTAYNFILQGYTSSGTLYIGGYTISSNMLSMTVKYIS